MANQKTKNRDEYPRDRSQADPANDRNRKQPEGIKNPGRENDASREVDEPDGSARRPGPQRSHDDE